MNNVAHRTVMNVIARYLNEDDGVEAVVSESTDGTFAVALVDVDSGETAGSAHGYPTEAAARGIASHWAGVGTVTP